MIKTGIIDDNHPLAGELLRLLVIHPDVESVRICNLSRAGEDVTAFYPDLAGDLHLQYTAHLEPAEVDILFYMGARGSMSRYADEHVLPADTAVVDFSGDYRIEATGHGFIYGLPELNRKRIVRGESRHIALPGDVAAALQLALLPMAKNLLLGSTVYASALVSATAGVQQTVTCRQVAAPCADVERQVVPEVMQNIVRLQNSFAHDLRVFAMQGSFDRGILATVWMRSPDLTADFARSLYADYYDDHSFVHITSVPPCVGQVMNTNKCFLHIDISGGLFVVTTVTDNLIKGAAGQAVHCMNLLFGLKETTGLMLKSSYGVQ